MNPDTANHLVQLNRQFYQTFAAQFSATRQRLQPGVQRVLVQLPPSARILDLGCGNGELWRALIKSGYDGFYTGLDFSAELLGIAENSPCPSIIPPDTIFNQEGQQGTFLQADLSAPDWDNALPDGIFDVVLAFAVLHHLPGRELHLQVLQKIRNLLAPNGRFIHSEWQFLNSPRLRARQQPWELVGLSPDQVDPGDYLLDWRHGGCGLRYVHHFDDTELEKLANESGFRILETFLSDGEGNRLGLYQIWERL